MKITNTRVYGLEESIIASRYPMMVETPEEKDFNYLAKKLYHYKQDENTIEGMFNDESIEKAFGDVKQFDKRANNLGKAEMGSGHSNFLKGIIVQADFTANQAWWLQYGRYHFADIISSQSKMHRLTRMDIDSQCNKWVSRENIVEIENWIKVYNNFEQVKIPMEKHGLELRNGEVVEFTKSNLFQLIINNCPTGLELTARITHNYLSLKTQYKQRVPHHPLEEWQDWRKWVEELPYFMQLTGLKKGV